MLTGKDEHMNGTQRYWMGAALLLLAALIPGGAGNAQGSEIRSYRCFFAELYTKERKLSRIALRRFWMGEREYYLAVDPGSLRTEIVPVGKYLVLKNNFDAIMAGRKETAYFKAMRFAGQNAWRIQNAGITRIPAGPAQYLTADLCPTRLRLDRALFTHLIAEYGAYHRPVSVAIAVSGTWLKSHQADLRWIKDLIRRKDLDVTWVNHTYSHRYKKRVPLWKNFLLQAGINIGDEVINNEVAMLEKGLVPSVFFRFPGLVSNRALVGRISSFGLIPLGSDAWLGKKQWPVRGSIILVHDNGQEPVGIKRFLWLLESRKAEIAAGRWILGSLAEGLCQAMKMY